MMPKRPFPYLFFLSILFLFSFIPVATADEGSYVVQPGDNLFRIALNHGFTTQELAQANGIVNVNHIYAGQTLIIPDRNAPTPTTTAVSTTYIVQPGDQLGRLAQRFGVSLSDLIQANNISNPNHIYYGQLLTIPGVASLPTPNPAPNSSPPPLTSATGATRWIDINLTTQTLVAYEGDTPVYSTAVSSGAWPYLTVTGEFSIYARYEAQTMNGYALGFNYYLPDVPYVMYFYGNYGLHGTYWHNNFGTPMSHGCVNLSTTDAEWLYNWSSYGTTVKIHY